MFLGYSTAGEQIHGGGVPLHMDAIGIPTRFSSCQEKTGQGQKYGRTNGIQLKTNTRWASGQSIGADATQGGSATLTPENEQNAFICTAPLN